MTKSLLLHACCGPCSIEPFDALIEAGYSITLAYINPNIHPRAEYERRLRSLVRWAGLFDAKVVEGSYHPEIWESSVGIYGIDREQRCRACYRLRLMEAAQLSRELGCEYLSTTLAVSPYQLFDACKEELYSAADSCDLKAVWNDYRSRYPLATKRAREFGLYRQCYCGCRFSSAEACLGRIQARVVRHTSRNITRCVEHAQSLRATT